jgi:hypothetical protein
VSFTERTCADAGDAPATRRDLHDHDRLRGIVAGMSDPQQPTNPALADLDALLADRGITVTAEGVAAARRRRLAVEREWTPARWAAVRERVRRAVAESDPHRGTSAA